MRISTTLILCFLLHNAYAQEFVEANHYLAPNGWNIKRRDTLYIGIGSNPDSSFQYITQNKKSYKGDYKYFIVSKIQKWKYDDKENVFLVLKRDGEKKTYTCKIDKAIEENEVVSADWQVIDSIGNNTINSNVYSTESGFKYKVGDILKIGTGTMPDGDFKFIKISSKSLFQYYTTTGNNAAVNQANAFSKGNSGYKYKIIRIDKFGNKKNGYKYYPIIETALVRYEIDIDNAIKSGEIASDFKSQIGQQVIINSPISVADELKKLKQLKDEGVLTDKEFEDQKQKLLLK